MVPPQFGVIAMVHPVLGHVFGIEGLGTVFGKLTLGLGDRQGLGGGMINSKVFVPQFAGGLQRFETVMIYHVFPDDVPVAVGRKS